MSTRSKAESPCTDRPAATSARHVTLIPSRHDLDAIRETLRAAVVLSDEQRSQIVTWAGRGAFSAALGVLQALIEAAPKNLSLFRLHEDLHGGFLELLVRRLGGASRQLVAVPRPPALMGAPYPTIVGLAEHPIAVHRIVDVLGGDPLATLERLIRLMTFGFLAFADGGTASGAPPAFDEVNKPTSGFRPRARS